MKQVTLQTEAISLNEVLKTQNPLIGFTNGGAKVTLVPVDYNSKMYFARSLQNWGNGDGYSVDWRIEHSITGWAQYFLSILSPNNKMFLFDSPKELFQWLAE